MQKVNDIVTRSTLDLDALVKRGDEAQRRIDEWPEWKREAARVTTCPCCTGRPSLGMPRKVML